MRRSTGDHGDAKIPEQARMTLEQQSEWQSLSAEENLLFKPAGSPVDVQSDSRTGAEFQITLPVLLPLILFFFLPPIFTISISRTQPTKGSDSLHRLQNATNPPPPWTAMTI